MTSFKKFLRARFEEGFNGWKSKAANKFRRGGNFAGTREEKPFNSLQNIV
jgi:hypothetical protein